jgi:hypothetical protein
MKKIFICLLCVICSFNTTGCFIQDIKDLGSKTSSVDPYNNASELSSVSSNQKSSELFSVDSSDTSIATSLKSWEQLLREGKTDSIEFGIGDRASDIVLAWGEPDEEGYFLGGSYYSYENVLFLIGRKIPDLEYPHVVIMGFGIGDTVFGVQVGMSFDEIQESLGMPTFEGNIGVDDELYGTGTIRVLDYSSGDFRLRFVGEENSETTYVAYLYKG